MQTSKSKRLGLIPVCLLTAVCTTGCSSQKAGVEYLRILNCEDYIYEKDEQSGYVEDDLINQFSTYMKEEYNRDVEVIYDTYDTNETMLNSIKTGKYVYDLICASDYTLQRMITQDLIIPFNFDNLENYNEYASTYLKECFKNITAKTVDGETVTLDKYACCYMWGTLGIVYNPTYSKLVERGYSEEEIHEDMNDWNVLWNNKYSNCASIKDSMRDTYSVGIMKTYDKDFKDLLSQYKKGELTSEQYNDKVSTIFNYGGEDDLLADQHINEVKQSLMDLRSNIFGFEVDSGKEDIVTGKVGINIAWSGDAVYALDKAEDPKETANPFELYYSIPETGGNIWFDGWVMQKGGNQELAEQFVNFVSDPVNASQNMDYIGYTPAIGGDDIIDLVREWYDVRAFTMYQTDENGDYIYDDLGNHKYNEGYENYTYETFTTQELEELGAEAYDASYFFDGTYDKETYTINGVFYDPGIIYTDTSGRQLEAQYPSKEKIPSLAVMRDFGSNNDKILKMWEDVKSEGLPLWGIILFIVEGVIVVAFAAIFISISYISKKRRKERRLVDSKNTK